MIILKIMICSLPVSLEYKPYSPALAPSDYRFFHSMQNFLKDKILNDADDVKSLLIHFFASKNQKFYEHGIMTLSESWHKVSKMIERIWRMTDRGNEMEEIESTKEKKEKRSTKLCSK
ncbi:Ammar1 transposase [Vespula squamosa]|uniref:Ammar1 transposase n=1 Tax=Vespula squamosa TaxID=30214 RepID=A0ABD2BW98_VESSQ